MRHIAFAAVLLLLGSAAAAGPLLTSKDLPGWDVSKPDIYNAKQLYGYIDGGAELYLEYGFREVSAQRAGKAAHEIQVDVYEMVSPEAAFGMYSVMRGNCAGTLQGAQWSCVKPEQILFARGAYLVSVIPYDRAKVTQGAAKKAAAAVLRHINGKDFRPPPPFGSGPLSEGLTELRYLHGPLALQSVLPSWSDVLKGIDRFDLFHTYFGPRSHVTEVVVLSTKSKRDMDAVLSQLGVSQSADAWEKTSEPGVLVKRKGATRLWYLAGTQAEQLSKKLK